MGQIVVDQNDQSRKRQKLFNVYSANIHMLVERGELNLKLQYDKTYVCPLCLDQFSEESLLQNSVNPLTLEDVPPVSLGGHANILTCKRCNNLCGQTIDSHLKRRIEELKNSKFIPGSKFSAIFSNNIIGKINGIISVNDDRTLTMIHDSKHNVPDKVDLFAESIKANDSNRYVNLEMRDLRVDSDKVAIALLKIAYLRMFEEFGYAFLWMEAYKRVRTQILNNDTLIYPTESWIISGEDIKTPGEGVFYLPEKGIECFSISFHLKLGKYIHKLCTLLPAKFPIQYTIKELLMRTGTSLSPEVIRYHLGFEMPEGQFQVDGIMFHYSKMDLANYDKTKNNLINIVFGG